MKKLKWIATLFVVVGLLLGVIGCKAPEIHEHTYVKAWDKTEGILVKFLKVFLTVGDKEKKLGAE